MNEELVKSRINQINDIYGTNGRTIPNAFKMCKILELGPKKYQFGEFVSLYKECNGGYF